MKLKAHGWDEASKTGRLGNSLKFFYFFYRKISFEYRSKNKTDFNLKAQQSLKLSNGKIILILLDFGVLEWNCEKYIVLRDSRMNGISDESKRFQIDFDRFKINLLTNVDALWWNWEEYSPHPVMDLEWEEQRVSN